MTIYPKDMADVILMERRRDTEQVNRDGWMFEGTPFFSSQRSKRSRSGKR